MDSEQAIKRRKIDGEIGDGRIAYLGPAGTYGNQAANAFAKVLEGEYKLVTCPDIPSIYTFDASYMVMPLQNTIHGGVTETLDSILGINHDGPTNLSPDNNDSEDIESSEKDLCVPRIIGDLNLPIRHCLVVKRGVKMDQIRWVRSHEQALGQSSAFLKEHLPLAKPIPWPSTAGAALSLLEAPNSADEFELGEGGEGAAICSKSVLQLYPNELELLYEGTQGITNNYTRFLLLSRVPDNSTPTAVTDTTSDPSDFYIVDSAEELSSFVTHGLSIRAIHIRPSPVAASSSTKENGVHKLGDQEIDRIDEVYPARYLVEVQARGPVSIGRYIGRTDIHVPCS